MPRLVPGVASVARGRRAPQLGQPRRLGLELGERRGRRTASSYMRAASAADHLRDPLLGLDVEEADLEVADRAAAPAGTAWTGARRDR